MRNPSMMPRGRRAGFSMVEVLVSIVVVTMGLLGLAGLSIRSMAANDSSGYRAGAAQSAMQITDALRTNRQMVVDGKFNVGFANTTLSDPRATAIVSSWKNSLLRLPQGDGSIAFDAVSQTALVTVRWDDRRGNQSSTESATTQTYAYSFRP